jgi:hypothetical protein
VVDDILERHETQVALVASYAESQHMLATLIRKAGASRAVTIKTTLGSMTAEGLPFGAEAWTALPNLLRAPNAEPELPPTGVDPADLLWALALFQALALMQLAGSVPGGQRPGSKPATRSRSGRPRRRR